MLRHSSVDFVVRLCSSFPCLLCIKGYSHLCRILFLSSSPMRWHEAILLHFSPIGFVSFPGRSKRKSLLPHHTLPPLLLDEIRNPPFHIREHFLPSPLFRADISIVHGSSSDRKTLFPSSFFPIPPPAL